MIKIIAVVCFLFTSAAFSAQLIIEPDMGREPILTAINRAHQSVHLVMYGFTDESLLNALLHQKQQGRTLKIILEQSPYKSENENNKTIQALESNQIAWHGEIPPLRLIHQKTLIIDGREALIMTFNFTKSTFKHERNFAIVIDDPQTVREIDDVFSADWNHAPTFHRLPQLIYSPDDSRAKLIKLISNAKRSIKVYAQTISDYKIIGALANTARQGVSIEILTSSSIQTKQAKYLQKSGVILHQSNHYYIHAKVFIIDGEIAVIGSINLTRASLDDNRELSFVTRDPAITRQLTTTFNNDFN